MQEDGLRGSKYCAQVLEVRQLAALVQYNELHEEGTDEDGRQILTEYVAHGLILPVPAPPPPGWLEAVEIETLLEVLYEGGWYVIATPLPSLRSRSPPSFPSAAFPSAAFPPPSPPPPSLPPPSPPPPSPQVARLAHTAPEGKERAHLPNQDGHQPDVGEHRVVG